MGYKTATVVVAALLLLASLLGFTKVKNLFFPDFDYNQFIVEYSLPASVSPQRVKEDLLSMSRYLLENPAVKHVSASMGSAQARYCLVRPMTSGGDSYGELIVECEDYKSIVEEIPEIRRNLREMYPDAYIRIRKYNFSISTSHTVEVEFSGPDPAVLRDLSRQAEEIMRRSPYVDPYSVQNNWRPRTGKLTVGFQQEDALRARVSRSDVGKALQAATDGTAVGVLYDQDRILPINLKVRNSDGSKIRDMGNVPVWSMLNISMGSEELQAAMTGGTGMDELTDRALRSVPLSSVAPEIRLEWEEACVHRLNGQRVIEAECDPAPDMYEATPAKVISSIKADIEAISLPDGYKMRWVGEGELQNEAIGNVMKYTPRLSCLSCWSCLSCSTAGKRWF